MGLQGCTWRTGIVENHNATATLMVHPPPPPRAHLFPPLLRQSHGSSNHGVVSMGPGVLPLPMLLPGLTPWKSHTGWQPVLLEALALGRHCGLGVALPRHMSRKTMG